MHFSCSVPVCVTWNDLAMPDPVRSCVPPGSDSVLSWTSCFISLGILLLSLKREADHSYHIGILETFWKSFC